MDEIFEKAWPFAIVLIVVIVVVGYYNVSQNNNESETKQEIIKACQSSENVSACVKELVDTTNKLD